MCSAASPALSAVFHHLRIQRIGLDFPPVIIGAPPALAIWLAANMLLQAIGRGLGSLAIEAAAGRDQSGSSESDIKGSF
jgi:hypothetical protein